MERLTMQNILIEILRSELNEAELDKSVIKQLSPDVISALFNLSQHHNAAHIVSACLYRNGLLNGDMLAKFQQKELMSVYRYEQMNHAYKQVCELFEKQTIPYIPLKGSVIRPYYPKESMRTSCDIDILVREQDLERAIASLEEVGYTRGKTNFHDVSMFFPGNIHLELHFSVLENVPSIDIVLKRAWDYARPATGSRFDFTPEFFVFHIFSHMSFHFLVGGCGLRALMDIWIIEHKMGMTYRDAKVLLEEAKIYTFAEEISRLADACFSGKPLDDFMNTMLSYIVNGGTYGTKSNRMAVEKAENTNTVIYSIKRLFLPYRIMVTLYPKLKRRPVLLPFFWLLRLSSALFGKKSKRARAEFKVTTNMSSTEIDTMKLLRERLGL